MDRYQHVDPCQEPRHGSGLTSSMGSNDGENCRVGFQGSTPPEHEVFLESSEAVKSRSAEELPEDERNESNDRQARKRKSKQLFRRIGQNLKRLQKIVPARSYEPADVASILDDVIQYLKQLQTQVDYLRSWKNTAAAAVVNNGYFNPQLGMLQQYPMSLLHPQLQLDHNCYISTMAASPPPPTMPSAYVNYCYLCNIRHCHPHNFSTFNAASDYK